MIQVTMVDANTYQVVVDGRGRRPTRHRVTLSQEYYRQLSGGTVTHEWVVVQAFQFLLEREANTSIRTELDLSDIGMRFDGFEADIGRRLGRSPPGGEPSTKGAAS